MLLQSGSRIHGVRQPGAVTLLLQRPTAYKPVCRCAARGPVDMTAVTWTSSNTLARFLHAAPLCAGWPDLGGKAGTACACCFWPSA